MTPDETRPCDGCGTAEARCVSTIREKGAVKCCPDCDHHAGCRAALTQLDAEIERLQYALDDIGWGGTHMDVRATMENAIKAAGQEIAHLETVVDEQDAEIERLRESVTYLESRVDRADNATSAVMDERDDARRRLAAVESRLEAREATLELRWQDVEALERRLAAVEALCEKYATSSPATIIRRYVVADLRAALAGDPPRQEGTP